MNNLSFKDHFATALRAALKNEFGRLPSTTFVAKHFNLRVTSNGVSGETVRRWVRGVSLPRCDHMQVLAQQLYCNKFAAVSDAEALDYACWYQSGYFTRSRV